MDPRVLVVVCTYNEAENVPVLTARLKALDHAPDVLFVDDDSPDGTWRLAEELGEKSPGVFVLRRTDDRGFAPSSLDGLRWGLDRGYDLVCQMDADLSHDPDDLPRIIEAVASDRADVCVGSRYVPGGGLKVDWGPIRRLTSTMGNAYIRFMLRTGVADNTTSLRCYRRDVLARVPLERITSRGYVYLPELMLRLVRAGARVAEVPSIYVDRQLGVSKISWKIVAEAFTKVTALGFTRLFTPRSLDPPE